MAKRTHVHGCGNQAGSTHYHRRVTAREWDPNVWQAYCEQLLTAHYGVHVQLIPDRGQGDGGLEAFVARDGVLFQCYAPEDPFSLQAQTSAQKKKIRDDLKKLIDNPKRTVELIGEGFTVSEWVLLTPAFEDKELIAYANARASDMRKVAADHPWCSESFRISVHDDRLFAAEKHKLFSDLETTVTPASARVAAVEARGLEEYTPGFDEVLDEKLLADQRLAANDRMRNSYKDQILQDYFRGAAELTRLAREMPALHQSTQACANVVFDGLPGALASSEERPTVMVSSLQRELQGVMSLRLPTMSVDMTMLLSRYFIAAWWLQCPLQFDVDVK